MKFYIDYTSCLEGKQIIYRKNEFSFDTVPYEYDIDFDISINMLSLSVIDSRIAQVNGFCGLKDAMHYDPPKTSKGMLGICHADRYESGTGSYAIADVDLPVFLNKNTGWVCIGNPLGSGCSVEFITGGIAVIDIQQELLALWLHPHFI